MKITSCHWAVCLLIVAVAVAAGIILSEKVLQKMEQPQITA